jgi:hypothetical protein
MYAPDKTDEGALNFFKTLSTTGMAREQHEAMAKKNEGYQMENNNHNAVAFRPRPLQIVG